MPNITSLRMEAPVLPKNTAHHVPHLGLPLHGARIAVVHDWLPLYGGAERVLEQILTLFPQADLFTLMDCIPQNQRSFLRGIQPRTSFIQRLPYCSKAYRHYFPLMPLAIEQFDLSGYDIVISSSYAFAKGVLTGPDQLHICYCHSPIRYAWDLQNQYLACTGAIPGLLARLLFHYIRLWDSRTAHGVNAFLANSRFISRRIHKTYGRDAQVVYPPVATDAFALEPNKEDYYLTASRLVPYKRIDLVVSAFARMPSKKLVVIGDGPELARVKSCAAPNVEIMGHQSAEKLRSLMQKARAFVFAAQEDFGITMVEAQACGTPVIAFGHGGAREIVIDGETGVLFQQQTENSLIEAVQAFETQTFDSELIRKNAGRFSGSNFREQFTAIVEAEYARLSGCL